MKRQTEKIKVFLDDERPAPAGWKQVRWPDEAIELLKAGNIEEISLDHDLGDDSRGSGYDVLLWIEEQVHSNNYKPPKIYIHTANVSARIKMELTVKNIYKQKE